MRNHAKYPINSSDRILLLMGYFAVHSFIARLFADGYQHGAGCDQASSFEIGTYHFIQKTTAAIAFDSGCSSTPELKSHFCHLGFDDIIQVANFGYGNIDFIGLPDAGKGLID